jgi:hypothetical protein
VDEKAQVILECIAKDINRIADTLNKQQPGKFEQVIGTGATIATIVGALSIADIVMKWITGD